MFKPKWRVARWTKDGELFVAEQPTYWFRFSAQMGADHLNETFSGLNGLAVILGGRRFFAIHIDKIELVRAQSNV